MARDKNTGPVKWFVLTFALCPDTEIRRQMCAHPVRPPARAASLPCTSSATVVPPTRQTRKVWPQFQPEAPAGRRAHGTVCGNAWNAWGVSDAKPRRSTRTRVIGGEGRIGAELKGSLSATAGYGSGLVSNQRGTPARRRRYPLHPRIPVSPECLRRRRAEVRCNAERNGLDPTAKIPRCTGLPR
jgi:hypothetical protein